MQIGLFFVRILGLLTGILDLYVWFLIIGAILSWLVALDIINPRNQVVRAVGDFYYRLTEPVLYRIRRVVPPMNGIDLSPLVLIMGVEVIKYLIIYIVDPLLLTLDR